MMTLQFLRGMRTTILVLALYGSANNAVDVSEWLGSTAQRTQHDPYRRGAIIPNTRDIIKDDGVIHVWRAYLSNVTQTDSRVRLQIWRPVFEVSGLHVAQLVGQTDFRLLSVFESGENTFNLEHHETIRVEEGDLIGLQFEGGNPVPFEEFQNCASGGEAKIMEVFSSLDYVMNKEEPFRRFRAINSGLCRTYSIAVQITDAGCMDIVAEPVSAKLRSTGYPTSYLPSTDVCWIIQASSTGAPAQLVVEEVGLAASCQYLQDYIEIRKGSSSTSPLLRRYCSSYSILNSELETYESDTGGALYIRFVTDGFREGRGFQFQYRSIWQPGLPVDTIQCAMVIIDTQPYILTSPDYPNNYPPNQELCWILVASVGNSRIRIEVTDSSLETWTEDERTRTTTCHDFVRIYDGDSTSSPKMREWCGEEQPGSLLSSGPELLVWFASNDKTEDRGYRLDFYTMIPEAVKCVKLSATSREQYIESQGYPYQYPANWMSCWILEATPGSKLILKLHDMRLESAESCSYDHIEIRDGLQGSRLLRRLCGQESGSRVISSGNQLYLLFQTDNSIQDVGFRIGYNQIEADACAVYTAYPRYLDIASPGFDDGQPYPKNTDMCWTIETPSVNSRIKLEIIKFELQSSSECNKDYVEFYDGGDMSGPVIGRWCGTQADGGIITNGPSLTFRFVSDSQSQAPGFKLGYISLPLHECRYLYANGKERWLTTDDHSWNSDISNTVYCWIIQADQGHDVISVNVRNVSVSGPSLPEEECDQDWLTIKDGNTRTSNVLSRVCGSDIPSETLVTSGQFALVTFVRKRSGHLGYFQLSYRSHNDDRCQTLNAVRHLRTLSSPGYPLRYAPNAFSCWILKASHDKGTIRLLIDDIDLDQDCHDYIDITDGESTEDVHLRRWCSTKRPNDISSSGSVISIRFISNGQSQGRGFKLSFWEEFQIEGSEILTYTRPTTIRSTTSRSRTTTAKTTTNLPITSPLPVTTFSTIQRSTTDPQVVPKSTTTGLTLKPDSCIIKIIRPGSGSFLLSSHQYRYATGADLPECWVLASSDVHAFIEIHVSSVTFTEQENSCSSADQYLEFRDGTSSDAPLITRLCMLPPGRLEFNTTGSSVYVYFRTKKNKGSFEIIYTERGGLEMKETPVTLAPSNALSQDLDPVFIGVVSTACVVVFFIIAVMIYYCVINKYSKDIPDDYSSDPYFISAYLEDDPSLPGYNNDDHDAVSRLPDPARADVIRSETGRNRKRLGLSGIGSTLTAMSADGSGFRTGRDDDDGDDHQQVSSGVQSSQNRNSASLVPEAFSLCLFESSTNVDGSGSNDIGGVAGKRNSDKSGSKGRGNKNDSDYHPKPNERMI